jgi:hypothetical protein
MALTVSTPSGVDLPLTLPSGRPPINRATFHGGARRMFCANGL